MKVKLFAATNCPDLEKMVNEFLNGFKYPKIQIHEIKYSTDPMYYSVMIVYISGTHK